MSVTHKLVFIGEPGAGKTTCIAALSDITPICTDVDCTDDLAAMKRTTTVAFDYGEMDLDEHGRLLLYGLPGQARFRFMFDVVREGLLGVVILVDASAADPLRALQETLHAYAGELQQHCCVVALNKHADPPPQLRRQCQQLLQQHALVAPIVSVDARQRGDIVRVFELLFLLLEHAPGSSHSEEATS